MHMSSHLRDPVLEAFDSGCPSPEDVINSLGGLEEANRVLSRLWNCSDILPGDIIDYVRSDWLGAERLAGTFGALAQWTIRYMEQ